MTRVAVIDIGTVTARLAVADVQDGKVVRMARQSTIVNLGEGVDKTSRLREDACARLLQCIDRYLGEVRAASVEGLCCTLTSAARDAQNSAELLGALKDRGLVAQIIPGKVEGMLTFLGVAQDFAGDRLLVADNGGGSTEFALGTWDAKEGLDVQYVRSIDVGCRRVTERFLSREDPPSAEDVRAAHEFAAHEFLPIASWWSSEDERPSRLVITGGTSTTLVAMWKGLEPYDSSQVHLAELTREVVQEQEERLAALTVAQRAELAGVQPQRAPVLLGGVVAVGEVLEVAGCSSLTVSESDLLFGLSLATASSVCNLPSPVGWRPEFS